MQIKKAFLLLEMIVSLMIVNIIFLSIKANKIIKLETENFIIDYLDTQSKALLTLEILNYEDINLNLKGNVNLARTIEFTNGKVVIHLGSGNIEKISKP